MYVSWFSPSAPPGASPVAVRMVLVKRPEENHTSDPGYDIMQLETFDHLNLGPNINHFMDEDIQSGNGEEFLKDWLKDKQDGFYEILAEFWYEAWDCGGWEGQEWDSMCELRNIKYQQLKYKDAMYLDKNDVLSRDGRICEYRPVKDVLREFVARSQHAYEVWKLSDEALKDAFERTADSEDKKRIIDYIADRALLLPLDFNSIAEDRVDKPVRY